MTGDLNKVWLEGVLITQPENRKPPRIQRPEQKLKSLTLFTIVNHQVWIGEGQKKYRERDNFFKVVVWGETWWRWMQSEGLRKGSRILLMGQIRREMWEFQGKKVVKLEIHVGPKPVGKLEILDLGNAKAPPPDGEGAEQEQQSTDMDGWNLWDLDQDVKK